MKRLLFILLLFLLSSSDAVFAQQVIKRLDSLYAAGKLKIVPVSEVNCPQGDYAPVLLNSGKLIFTSERVNPETREMSLAGNQNVYEYNSKNGKTKYSYFYNTDDHSAVAGISADRKAAFLFRAWNGGDIYATVGLSGKEKYNHFKRISFPLNTDESQEQSASSWNSRIVFSSDRTGGAGGFDLYCGIADEKVKLSSVLLIDSVNAPSDETDVRFMSDGTLLFSSNRDGKFKRRFPAFDTTALRMEYEMPAASSSDSVRKYLIDQTYMTLREAALRQQVALRQQADKINLYESPVDAFIAVYDARNVRIVIFFNVEKKDYKILVGDEVVYF